MAMSVENFSWLPERSSPTSLITKIPHPLMLSSSPAASCCANYHHHHHRNPPLGTTTTTICCSKSTTSWQQQQHHSSSSWRLVVVWSSNGAIAAQRTYQEHLWHLGAAAAAVWSSSNGAGAGASLWNHQKLLHNGSSSSSSSTNGCGGRGGDGGCGSFGRCRALRKEGGGGAGLLLGHELPPGSREEAVEQAGASVLALLEKMLKRRQQQQQGPTTTVKQRKEQKKKKQVRLCVEVPVLDDSPAALVSLTLELLASSFVDRKPTTKTTIVLPPIIRKLVFLPEMASLKLALEKQSAGQEESESLRGIEFKLLVPEFDAAKEETAEEDRESHQVLFIVAPKLQQAGVVARVLEAFHPCPVVLLNPGWSPEDEEEEADSDMAAAWGTLMSSFEVAYSYLPLAVQGIFSKTEGAVLKYVKSGAPPGGRPWLIFVKQNDRFSCVSSLPRRPRPADLESAFYNSMAANSPVTKSIRLLRGLVSKQ